MYCGGISLGPYKRRLSNSAIPIYYIILDIPYAKAVSFN